MTLGFEVLVQEVIAAITTSPWRSSTWAIGNSSAGTASTRSGVGRFCIISISVTVAVLRSLSRPAGSLPLVCGVVLLSCSPPPLSVISGWSPCTPVSTAKRCASSSADLL